MHPSVPLLYRGLSATAAAVSLLRGYGLHTSQAVWHTPDPHPTSACEQSTTHTHFLILLLDLLPSLRRRIAAAPDATPDRRSSRFRPTHLIVHPAICCGTPPAVAPWRSPTTVPFVATPACVFSSALSLARAPPPHVASCCLAGRDLTHVSFDVGPTLLEYFLALELEDPV